MSRVLTELRKFFFGDQIRKYFVLFSAFLCSQIISFLFLGVSDHVQDIILTIILSLSLVWPITILYDGIHGSKSLYIFKINYTFFTKVYRELEPIIVHACVVILLILSSLVVRIFITSLAGNLLQDKYFISIVEETNYWFIVTSLLLFGIYTVLIVSLKVFKALFPFIIFIYRIINYLRNYGVTAGKIPSIDSESSHVVSRLKELKLIPYLYILGFLFIITALILKKIQPYTDVNFLSITLLVFTLIVIEYIAASGFLRFDG
jgi:hypothetical protein